MILLAVRGEGPIGRLEPCGHIKTLIDICFYELMLRDARFARPQHEREKKYQ
jgi:hypothetical protein